jgi:hypothetical protein
MMIGKVLAVTVVTGTLLVSSGGTAFGASTGTTLNVAKRAPIEFDNGDFTQIAVTVKVKCTGPDPTSLSVFVSQGSTNGVGFVSSVTCDGTPQKAVAHVQSNFGSHFQPGTARANVTENNTQTIVQDQIDIG